MAIDFSLQHPAFVSQEPDWTLVADAHAGEQRIKGKGETYLPITSGQYALGIGQGTDGKPRPGQLLYNAYLRRAVFPDILRMTAAALVGLMVRESWNVELPPAIDYLKNRATPGGESMTQLIRRILSNVLLTGRIGLLNDVRESTNEIYIIDYPALNVINWDNNPTDGSPDRTLRLVVLDESRFERALNALEWKESKRYRVAALGAIDELDVEGVRTYTTQVQIDGNQQPATEPSLQGRMLDYVPFTFINATDLTPEPGEVSLLGLARLAVTIYRGEADYRHTLFMQGQDTLVLRGVANPNAQDVPRANDDGHVPYNFSGSNTGSKVIIGAGAVIYLPMPEMDAKFIGVDSQGLSEQREALENDYKRAEQFGVALLTSGSEAEAADTIHTRVTARTASLASIVQTAAAGLLQQLQWAAEWAGADPSKVVVEPNLNFVEQVMSTMELNGLIGSKMQGFPISWRTIHQLVERGGLTALTLEEELEEIDREPALGLDVSVGEEVEEENDGGRQAVAG